MPYLLRTAANLVIASCAVVSIALSPLLAAEQQRKPESNPITDVAIEYGTEYAPLIEGDEYSPYVDGDYPMNLYWGDTHLHSSLSADANSAGNEKLSPADAYRFARGDQVTANNGMRVRLNTPLDFLVVSDHAEYLGLMAQLKRGDPALATTATGRDMLSRLAQGKEEATKLFTDVALAFMHNDNKFQTENFSFDNWRKTTAIADQYNTPGQFTTLIGYEWTSFPDGDNLHRVVVYKDGADKATQLRPFSANDGAKPEQLWAFLERYEKKTGGDILAIPHNGNVSNGLMFGVEDSDGNTLTAEHNAMRAKWEPIVEVTQIKGDGETHPFLSPDDEFADFETWDQGNLNPFAMLPKDKDMLQYEYARSALKIGLQQENETGVNPYKFGMIGSTDAHTSLATAAENNFWGKASPMEPGVDRSKTIFFKAADKTKNDDVYAWQQVAAGYAAVWAKENTRAALFEAMERREVYATTGSRIAVRFFGGWNYNDDDHLRPDLARIGYRSGVPMGSDLTTQPAPDQTPRFLVSAVKDPQGANLDRIQIVKGWLDGKGGQQEKVYNVAVSDGRKISRKGRVNTLTSTVDLEQVSFTNDIGAAQLATVWQDPDFDPMQRAFYYARVLEIPTPRWTEYDQKIYGVENPPNAVREIQDRAYTSPIWYTPQ